MEDNDFTINGESVFNTENFKDKIQTDSENDENKSQELHRGSSTPTSTPSSFYISLGKEWCGQVRGKLSSLDTALQAVYGQILQHLRQDKTRTATKKKEYEAKKTNLESDLKSLNDKLAVQEEKLEEKDKEIKDKQEQLNDIKSGKSLGDRDSKITLIISAVILIGITIYLFMFYSSTAYSAFFKNWDNATSIMEAMLDPHCIQNALHSGFIEFIFILFLPLLFMGLGFTVHQINKTTNDKKMGYLKTAALYTLTFAFDCLLAYKISSSLYQVIVIDPSPVAVPPFTFGMAAHNVDFWTVIFCGFVAYVIWGLVFSAFMNAYDKLFNKKTKMEIINKDIDKLKEEKEIIQTGLNNLQDQIHKIEAEIQNIIAQLGSDTIITWESVQTRFAKFISGWIAQMNFLGKPNEDCNEAKRIYTETLNIIKDKNFGTK